MSTPPDPPRIFIILARETSLAVVIRRGPSKHTQLLLWNRETDEFTPGQWFKGRVYEKRCDLSPSGKYFVYFGGKQKPPIYTYTVVSKPPYFTALALWADGCEVGGGLFENDTKLILNHSAYFNKMEPRFKLGEDFKIRALDYFRTSEYNLFFQRLVNYGWSDGPDYALGAYNRDQVPRMKFYNPRVFWKELRNEKKSLSLVYSVEGFYNSKKTWVDSYSIVEDGQPQILNEVEWADIDKNGELLFAKSGKIFRLKNHTESNFNDLSEAQELIDLSKFEFEEMVAPDWAKEW